MRSLLVTCHLSLVTLLCGCETQRTELKTWWSSTGKANTQATISLIAQEAAAIAEKTVYAKAGSAEDAVAKNWNVQGFGDGLRQLEGGAIEQSIAEIPSFVMHLRDIWLPGQKHYTDLAANVASLIEQKYIEYHPQTAAERTAIIEGVIKGLQTTPPALNGP